MLAALSKVVMPRPEVAGAVIQSGQIHGLQKPLELFQGVGSAV